MAAGELTQTDSGRGAHAARNGARHTRDARQRARVPEDLPLGSVVTTSAGSRPPSSWTASWTKRSPTRCRSPRSS